MADVEAVGRFGRAVFKYGGGGAELRKSKRRERVALRVGADRAGEECVGVMREIVAAPMLGPSLGVVRDYTIGAPKQLEVGACSHDGGFPGFSAAYVSVRGRSTCG